VEEEEADAEQTERKTSIKNGKKPKRGQNKKQQRVQEKSDIYIDIYKEGPNY